MDATLHHTKYLLFYIGGCLSSERNCNTVGADILIKGTLQAKPTHCNTRNAEPEGVEHDTDSMCHAPPHSAVHLACPSESVLSGVPFTHIHLFCFSSIGSRAFSESYCYGSCLGLDIIRMYAVNRVMRHHCGAGTMWGSFMLSPSMATLMSGRLIQVSHIYSALTMEDVPG